MFAVIKCHNNTLNPSLFIHLSASTSSCRYMVYLHNMYCRRHVRGTYANPFPIPERDYQSSQSAFAVNPHYKVKMTSPLLRSLLKDLSLPHTTSNPLSHPSPAHMPRLDRGGGQSRTPAYPYGALVLGPPNFGGLRPKGPILFTEFRASGANING